MGSCYDANPLPPVEELNELFEYNPETGILTYKISRGGWIMAGRVVGTKDKNGYIRVKIMTKKYATHRLIWKMFYGEDIPEDKVIDHINQVKDDNRICNLRLVSQSENSINSVSPLPLLSGVKCIQYEKRRQRYVVRVAKKYIKSCKTVDEAIEILNQYNDNVI
jgi:hypothetical protein